MHLAHKKIYLIRKAASKASDEVFLKMAKTGGNELKIFIRKDSNIET